MTELLILDGRPHTRCSACFERLHHFKDRTDFDRDGIDRVKWVWGWNTCKLGKKFYRTYMPDDAVNMATLNGVLEVPFYTDSGNDANIISEEMLEALKTKTEDDVVQLVKTWKDGDDVGEPDEDEVNCLRGGDSPFANGEQDLEKLDEEATASLSEKAFETLKIKHVKTRKLKEIVTQVSAKGVWRAQFRGTISERTKHGHQAQGRCPAAPGPSFRDEVPGCIWKPA
ncbi:hypothetical protein DYB35_006044 [Aphanomyces astaci]|uniref:Uncharacterized protein n=1 Tax=Aphanomyces astaci TaxID=112090 RepID=A0A3R7BLC7_APHAT|nr:hypothetical protein DYB35_006044 [Aphanomyces astaci]